MSSDSISNQSQIGPAASSGTQIGAIAARLDRLPPRSWHWKGVLIAQLFWAAVLMMDPLVLRLYPVVWDATIITSFGLTGCLGSMYNYTAAAFPTRVRSTGITLTDGVGRFGATFGPVIAGFFYAAMASSNSLGWFLWVGIIGALPPGLLIYFFGQKQSGAVLEELSK